MSLTIVRAVAALGLLGSLITVRPAVAQPQAADTRPVLRACFDPDDMPFSQAARHPGEADRGLFVDLAKAIADQMGRRLEPVWYVMQFARHAAREELLGGKCDAFFALPRVEGWMGKRVVFSAPILHEGYALVSPPGLIVNRLSDLDRRRVLVQFGSPPQSLLADRERVQMLTRMTPDEALASLAAHQADAAIIWGPSAGFLNHTLYADRFTVTPLAGPGMEFDAAIGFDARHADLRDAVDAALARLGPLQATLAAAYGLPQAPPRALTAAEPPARPAWRHVRYLALPTPADLALRAIADAPAGDPREGREIINTYCSHCHGPDARAPVTRQNLHLLKHRYGDEMDQVFMTTVHNGRPAKGMPNWTGVLTEAQFADILAYLHTSQD